jgi:hypothetical protein
MSLPRTSLGFLNEKAVSGCGRTRDRLWLGRSDRGQFARSHSEGDGRNRASDAQPLSHTECRPPTLAGSAGDLPRRRERRADVSDELSVDGRTGPL